MPWAEPKLLFSLLNQTNWITLTEERRDTLLLPALLSSSEGYTGAMEELELLLKGRSKKCLVVKKWKKIDFLYILFQERSTY
jgi:hypothetical protein